MRVNIFRALSGFQGFRWGNSLPALKVIRGNLQILLGYAFAVR
ncbi:hypothetical protein SLEP1_g25588 [Rubroshorea leprosula]|uniref:Uncharacterized protein n=1 Tax=Rubroshorea leprosula TaxID=152421 RepID=A0AAV5JJK1_9ROSI|nr:hypothetical protein SLEP1_g25588 [Rubroshorea leprosula]